MLIASVELPGQPVPENTTVPPGATVVTLATNVADPWYCALASQTLWALCWDNAVAESFWESLKRECVQGRVFATRAEARRAIFKWINWYNTSRLHSTLGDVPPLEWEQQYQQAS